MDTSPLKGGDKTVSKSKPECPAEVHEVANPFFSCDGTRCYKCPFKTLDRMADAMEKLEKVVQKYLGIRDHQLSRF